MTKRYDLEAEQLVASTEVSSPPGHPTSSVEWEAKFRLLLKLIADVVFEDDARRQAEQNAAQSRRRRRHLRSVS